MPEIRLDEKLPGTYCPLCGEIGLRRAIVKGIHWAVCPMQDGEPTVKKVAKAHTAYMLSGLEEVVQVPDTEEETPQEDSN